MARTKKCPLECPSLQKMHQKYKAIKKKLKTLPIKKRTLCSFYSEPLPKPEPSLPKPASTSAAPSAGTSATTTAVGTQTNSRYQVAAVERPMTRRESRRVRTESDTSSPSTSGLSSIRSSAVSSPAPSAVWSRSSTPSSILGPTEFPRMQEILTNIANDESPLDLSIRAAAPPPMRYHTTLGMPRQMEIYTNCLWLFQLEDM